jgi:hypothetical protein
MRQKMSTSPSKNVNGIPYKQKHNTNATPWISLSQEGLIPKAMTSLLIPHPKTYKKRKNKRTKRNKKCCWFLLLRFCCNSFSYASLIDFFNITFKSFQLLHSRSNLSQNFVHGFRRRQNARSEWLHHMSKRQSSNASLV